VLSDDAGASDVEDHVRQGWGRSEFSGAARSPLGPASHVLSFGTVECDAPSPGAWISFASV
jgi:hypothetical protein